MKKTRKKTQAIRVRLRDEGVPKRHLGHGSTRSIKNTYTNANKSPELATSGSKMALLLDSIKVLIFYYNCVGILG